VSGALANHLWQSTIFTLAAGLLAATYRRNHASVRYWLWFSASVKFLVPFTLLIGLGRHIEWVPAAQQIAAPVVSSTIVQISQPFTDAWPSEMGPVPSSSGTSNWLGLALLSAWACGFLAIALIRF
jgi:bla regulator protein BlaR1